MKADISVIVCCYNSTQRLPQTLKHLALQELNGLGCELIVVDNNSSDNTASTAESCWKNNGSPYPIRIVSEKTPGLSHARKKGIETASAEILLYCDDDNWLNENYIFLAHKIMTEDSDIVMLGGIGEPVFEGEKPVWFDNYMGNYAVGPHFEKKIGDKTILTLYGAGFVVRKSFFKTLDDLGFKSLLVGRKGKELTSGEDTEYYLLANLLDLKLVSESRLKFKHFIPANRLNFSYLKRWHYGYGKSKLHLNIYTYYFTQTELPKSFKLPHWLNLFLFKLRKLIKFYPKIFFVSESQENYDFILEHKQILGEISELFRLKRLYTEEYEFVRNMTIKYNKN